MTEDHYREGTKGREEQYVKRTLIRMTALLTASVMMLSYAGCSAEKKTSDTVNSEEEQAGSVSETVLTESSQTEDTEGSVEPTAEPADAPAVTVTGASSGDDIEWQIDVSFPDWKGSRSSSYAVNNRIGFYSYSGQGEIYVKPDGSCGSFSMYINGYRIDTSEMKAGGEYRADISSVTVNGLNSLQISDITEGTVGIRIAYPTVIPGTLSDAGLSEEAIKLIDCIISSDIENGFSSAQLAVVKDGKLIYEGAWGNVMTYDRNGEAVDAPAVTTDTLYDLASNTKMYSVNYAVQYLMTRGMISPDDRIVDILGQQFADDTIEIDYEGYEAVSLETNREWKASLTVRDLLCHQAGFPSGPQYFNDRWDNATCDFDSDNGNVLYAGTGADEKTREETLAQIFRTPLMYEPGTATMYSDLDYMILCYCVEEITGMRMDEFLSEVFWKPMGLTHITYAPLENGFTPDQCAATELMGNSRDGHVRYTGIRDDVVRGEVHDPNAYYCMAGVSGHAGLFSNATDLAILASVMLTGGYGENMYFSRDVIDLFTSPKSADDPDYGLGWWREAYHGRDWYFGSVSSTDIFGHQGFTGTLTVIDPDEDLVIVLLTNKIHSRILEGDETLNKYKGGFYTTATLGFVTEIIEMGINDSSDHDLYVSLLSDMIADAERVIDEECITDPDHPRMRAYKALTDAKEKFG